MQPNPFPEDMKYSQPTEPNPPIPNISKKVSMLLLPTLVSKANMFPPHTRVSKVSQYHHPISTQLHRPLFSKTQL